MPRTIRVTIGDVPVLSSVHTDPIGITDSISTSLSGGTFGPVSEPQGDWRPSFGNVGYALLSSDNTATGEQSLPSGVSIARTQGDWFYGGTADQTDRALLKPPGDNTRRYGAWYHATAVIITITFTNAWSGMIRVYSMDHDSTVRRQTVKIDDGSNPAAVALGQFDQGMWVGRSVTVSASGTVVITATLTAGGSNAVVNAIMLDTS